MRRVQVKPRNRLYSDSTEDFPKSILKKPRVPTKRSVSECVDDLSNIMADLNLNIRDLPQSRGKFCYHNKYKFHEEDEEEETNDCDDNTGTGKSERKENLKSDVKCDCYSSYDDDDYVSDTEDHEPKKLVRFDDKVYETVFLASRLYDKRSISKYHFSSRHHPPENKKRSSKSKSNHKNSSSTASNKAEEQTEVSCKQSRSQRSKQSKRDKKKRLNSKRDDSNDTSSGDDQGYHSSSLQSFSD